MLHVIDNGSADHHAIELGGESLCLLQPFAPAVGTAEEVIELRGLTIERRDYCFGATNRLLHSGIEEVDDRARVTLRPRRRIERSRPGLVAQIGFREGEFAGKYGWAIKRRPVNVGLHFQPSAGISAPRHDEPLRPVLEPELDLRLELRMHPKDDIAIGRRSCRHGKRARPDDDPRWRLGGGHDPNRALRNGREIYVGKVGAFHDRQHHREIAGCVRCGWRDTDDSRCGYRGNAYMIPPTQIASGRIE